MIHHSNKVIVGTDDSEAFREGYARIDWSDKKKDPPDDRMVLQEDDGYED